MTPTSSSTHSSLRKRKVLAWDCPSAGELLTHMGGDCGHQPIRNEARPFPLYCLSCRNQMGCLQKALEKVPTLGLRSASASRLALRSAPRRYGSIVTGKHCGLSVRMTFVISQMRELRDTLMGSGGSAISCYLPYWFNFFCSAATNPFWKTGSSSLA